MRVKVFWVSGPWRGKLGILWRPRGGEWLEEETNAWREAGINMVVSLLEPGEEAQLALEAEAAVAGESGVEFRRFPIPDRGVPASRRSVAELANGIIDALETGRNVAVHCRQGIGRSALIVGAVLVAAGKAPLDALKMIEESRGLEVPETEDQRQWLKNFASWLLATVAARRNPAADRA